MTEAGSIEATVRACERYWRRTGVPRDAVEDMRGELEAHLLEAAAAGRPAVSVIGTDVEAFAEEWAREFRSPVRAPRGGGAGPVVLAVIAGFLCVLIALMIPASSTTTVTECCPERVVEVSSDGSGAGLAIALLLIAAGVLALAGAWALRREQLKIGAMLLGVAAAGAVVTPLGLVAALLLVIAAIWTLWRRGGAPGPRGWAVASLVLAGSASLIALIGPLGSTTSGGVDADGRASIVSSHSTLIAHEGWYIVAVVAVPVAIALVPVLAQGTTWARAARWTAAVLLIAGVLVAMASIGLLYLPSAGAMLVAATSGADTSASIPTAPR